MLLPANPGPELLTLASNALSKSESVFTNEYELAWFRFHRSLLEYRSGRYAEALASARQAAEWRGKSCRVYSLLIQSMASQRLGNETEARRLWQQAADSIAELRKLPKNLMNICNLLLIELFLEEATSLLGLDGQKSLEQEAGALRKRSRTLARRAVNPAVWFLGPPDCASRTFRASLYIHLPKIFLLPR